MLPLYNSLSVHLVYRRFALRPPESEPGILRSAGYENIDMAAAVECGIPVTNGPGINSASVAEAALMTILMLARKVGLSGLGLHRRRQQFDPAHKHKLSMSKYCSKTYCQEEHPTRHSQILGYFGDHLNPADGLQSDQIICSVLTSMRNRAGHGRFINTLI